MLEAHGVYVGDIALKVGEGALLQIETVILSNNKGLMTGWCKAQFDNTYKLPISDTHNWVRYRLSDFNEIRTLNA